MKYASCRMGESSAVFYKFEKDYNKVSFLGSKEIDFAGLEDFLKEFDFIDILFPASKVLYFIKQYPVVKKNQLEMIIEQDIETITHFKTAEIVFDIKQQENGQVTVYIVKKSDVAEIVDRFINNSSKIRSIIPEHEFISSGEREKSVIIGDDYSAMLDDKSQIVAGDGAKEIELRSISRISDDAEYKEWLGSLGKIDAENSSEEEILIKKSIDRFIENTISTYSDFFSGKPALFFITALIPSAIESYLKTSLKEANTIFLSDVLAEMPSAIEKGAIANFAKDEFAYKGGFEFYKRKMIAVSIMLFSAFIIFIISMQIKISNVNSEIEKLDSRTKTLTKEILGKEYPSLRQAVSVMEKTIKGDETNEKKKVYPYSSLYVMEELFPLLTFEESSIEIREFSFKDGKVRFVGNCDKLEDFNKMVENLEAHKNVKNLNKGQIRNIKGKNDFSIGFDFVTESEKKAKEDKSKKTKGAN